MQCVETMVAASATQLVRVNEAAGLAGGATGFTTGPFSVAGFLNGRLRGNAHQDVAGTMLVEFSSDGVNFDLAFTVAQDATVPNFQYPFDIVILQPFARISFTNGGAASSFFRANAQALQS